MMLRSWLGCIAGAADGTFSVYDVHTEEGRVRCTASVHLNVAGGSVPIVLEVVLDQLDGLYAPFLLTRHSFPPPAVEKTCTHQLWKYSSSRRALHMCHTFEAAPLQPNQHGGGRYQLMDGPVVLWTEGEKLHLQTSTRHLTLNLRTYSQFPPTAPLAVTAFWAFGHPRDDDMALVFVQTEGCSPGGPGAEREWLCLEAKVNGLCAEPVPANKFVPRDYGSIATCIAVHRSHVVNGTAGCIVARHFFVVGTAYKQVIVLHDGQPLHIIPVLLAPTMVTASEVMGGQIAVITLDEGHNAYAHTTKPNNQVERYAVWSGASKLLVGDFTSVGHNQLLVVSEGKEGISSLESCRLYDLSEPPSNSEVQVQQRMEDLPRKVSTSSLVEALGALDVRMKIGELYLCDLEKELENKTELLEHGLQFLRSLQIHTFPSQNTPPPLDPALVTLLPGAFDEVFNGEHHGMTKPASLVAERPVPRFTHTIRLSKQWQRFIDQRWIVGVVIQSDRPLPNISVTLVGHGGGATFPHTCTSKVMWLKEGKTVAMEPRAKRLRMDASCVEEEHVPQWSVCVVAVCEGVPTLEKGLARGSVVCSWNGQGDVGSQDLETVSFSCDDLVVDALACDERCLLLWQGNCNLTMLQDEFSNKHVQDLACMLAAGIVEKVQVTSTHTSLSCFPAMLRVRLPSYIPVLSAMDHDGNVGHSLSSPTWSGGGSSGGLRGVALYVTVGPAGVTLSVLHRTASQLSLVMSLVHSVLSEDVSITRHCETETQMVSTALGCLEEELSTLVRGEPACVERCTASDYAMSSLLFQTMQL